MIRMDYFPLNLNFANNNKDIVVWCCSLTAITLDSFATIRDRYITMIFYVILVCSIFGIGNEMKINDFNLLSR